MPSALLPAATNKFQSLLRLSTVAFGNEEEGELWLVTDYPEWGMIPLRHAQTSEGFREVEGALGTLINDRAERRRARL